jgi:hypothetical protein
MFGVKMPFSFVASAVRKFSLLQLRHVRFHRRHAAGAAVKVAPPSPFCTELAYLRLALSAAGKVTHENEKPIHPAQSEWVSLGRLCTVSL